VGVQMESIATRTYDGKSITFYI